MFAFERDGVVPDILMLSKTLGAGLPLSAVMTTDAMSRTADERGLPVLHDARERPAAGSGRAEGAGDRAARRVGGAARRVWARGWRRGCARLQQRYDCIGDVRGRGLLLGMEFDAIDRGGKIRRARSRMR